MEALSLFDVSAEDDFLLDLASPPPHPDPPRAAGSSSVVGAGDSGLVPSGGSPAAAARRASEQVPERTESPKKTKAKSGFNLRKSLAWDSAFFTSEGVLDSEELGIVNSNFHKAQGPRLLPGIAEELRRSGESISSTLESENFMLESLETELFDNVRASIQRTLGKPDKAQGMTASSSKTPRATVKAPPVAARKGVDRIPKIKISHPLSTRNCGVGTKQRLQVTTKAPPAAGVALQRAAEAKPSSKPPRALPRVAAMRAPTNTATTSEISDKRSSTGGVVNRHTVGKSANASSNMQYRSSGMTKSSSTLQSGALSSVATSSLHNAPIGSLPTAKKKSPTLINKNRTAQRVNIHSSSRSDISNDNPARASKNKIPTRSHGERASLIISPSSSLDSMSSVVSGASTASTIGKMSHTSESFSTRSSPLSPSLRKSNDQPSTTKPTPPTVTEGQFSVTSSVDKLKASKDTTTHGKSVRPSGLRRPTPKIGYFDQQEPKPMAAVPHEESSPRTKASSLFLRLAQIEAEPYKVTKHEASMYNTSSVVDVDVAEEIVPALHQNIWANGDVAAVAQEESSPQSKTSPSLLLRLAQIEAEASKVTEHEASMCNTSTVVNADVAKEIVPALHQNFKVNNEASPLTAELLSPKMSKPLSAACEESIPSQTKTGLVVSSTMDTAKENIPALHHPNIQCTEDASPLSLLTKKLSSISIADASPLSLLAQKLSSISLGETTDQASRSSGRG